MGSRAATQAYILKYIDAILPNSDNTRLYTEMFKKMSNDEFDQFMKDLETEKKFLTITAPNFGKDRLSTERNLKIAKEIGHRFFQRLWIGAQGEIPAYLTPVEYLVIDLPLRRTSQMLIKKISMPEHNKTVDILSGQPTGDSKGGRISFPELQVLSAMGLDNSIVEMIKYRGGDRGGFNALNGTIGRYGKTNLKELERYATGVESVKTLKTFLQAMHLKPTGI